MLSGLSSVVKRHSIITFFVLAHALSWWAWVLYAPELFPTPSQASDLSSQRSPCSQSPKAGVGWRSAAANGALASATKMVRGVAQRPARRPDPLRHRVGGLDGLSVEHGRSRAGGDTPLRACKPAARHSLPA